MSRIRRTPSWCAVVFRFHTQWNRLLNAAQSYTRWRQVIAFLRTRPYAEVLADLAVLAPVLDVMGAQNGLVAVANVLIAAERRG